MFTRLLKLHLGLALFSVAIALMVKANIGVAPWDVFHQGISLILGISFGQAAIGVGLAIMCVSFFLKEKIGYGTISNMILIGLFIDWLFVLDIIPISNHILVSVIMLITGMFLAGFASYLYIGAAFGAGPRDSMMVALVKKTGLSLARIRTIIEIVALVLGFFMGGQVGVGTLILALGIGPVIQLVFHYMKFDVKSVKHQWLIGD